MGSLVRFFQILHTGPLIDDMMELVNTQMFTFSHIYIYILPHNLICTVCFCCSLWKNQTVVFPERTLYLCRWGRGQRSQRGSGWVNNMEVMLWCPCLSWGCWTLWTDEELLLMRADNELLSGDLINWPAAGYTNKQTESHLGQVTSLLLVKLYSSLWAQHDHTQREAFTGCSVKLNSTWWKCWWH